MTESTSFFGPFWIGRVKRSPSTLLDGFFSVGEEGSNESDGIE